MSPKSDFRGSNNFNRKCSKKFSMYFLCSVEYYLHFEKFLSNSVDMVKNLRMFVCSFLCLIGGQFDRIAGVWKQVIMLPPKLFQPNPSAAIHCNVYILRRRKYILSAYFFIRTLLSSIHEFRIEKSEKITHFFSCHRFSILSLFSYLKKSRKHMAQQFGPFFEPIWKRIIYILTS